MAEEGRLQKAVVETKAELGLLNQEKSARWQEKLGRAVLVAYHRDPTAGNVFQTTFQQETARLKRVEERTSARLESELKSLITQEAQFHAAIPRLYEEAIQSAHRSNRMRDESQTIWALRNINEIDKDLSWQRLPQDYVKLVSVVQENLRGYHGMGGFVEYGFAALAGLLVSMAWVGSSVMKDQFKISFLETKEPTEIPLSPHQRRKEIVVMPQTITVFSWPKEVIFGCNITGEVGRHASKNNVWHAMILTDEGISQMGLLDQLKASFFQEEIPCQVYDQVKREVPDAVIAHVFDKCKQAKTDLLVAVGGGSVIDTAKAVGILLAHGGKIHDYEGTDRVPGPIVPIYVVPTTSGCGSEASQFCVFLDTKKKKKTEIISRRIIPKMIFIDPLMTLTMSPELTASCGVDALGNCIEAYFSTWASPLTDALALHAIRLISGSLRAAVANGNDVEARKNMALAAFEAALAFTNARPGAAHALGHPLAGTFNIPQRLGNVILLPHVMRYNMNANMDRMVDVAVAMGEQVGGLSKREAAEKTIMAVQLLMVDIGLPTTLYQVGAQREAISRLSEQALQDTFLKTNPRVLSSRDIEHIYESAFEEYAWPTPGSAGQRR